MRVCIYYIDGKNETNLELLFIYSFVYFIYIIKLWHDSTMIVMDALEDIAWSEYVINDLDDAIASIDINLQKLK